MIAFFVQLLVTAVLLLVVSNVVRDIEARDFRSTLIAAVVLGIANALVKPLLLFITGPLSILTLGLWLLVVNALMWMLVSFVVPGFQVKNFKAAFFGSLLFAVMNTILSWVF